MKLLISDVKVFVKVPSRNFFYIVLIILFAVESISILHQVCTLSSFSIMTESSVRSAHWHP